MRHFYSPLINDDSNAPLASAQFYLVDPLTARDHRKSSDFGKDCDQDLQAELDALLRDVNPFVKSCLTMKELMDRLIREHGSTPDIRMIFVKNPADTVRNVGGTIVGRNSFNATYNEVAVFFDCPETPRELRNEICVYSLYTVERSLE